jgi:hypothetical protein
MDGSVVRVPQNVEDAIKEIAAGDNPAQAAVLLASIANRAAAALHQLARTQGSAHKGQADWGRWASLANVSRDAVLRTATSRQTASQIAKIGHSAETQPSP